MESFVSALIDWFSLPENGLSTVFLIAFLSATLLPLGSEPAVFGYAKLNPDHFLLVVLVATAGNTLGGVVDFWMGRGARRAFAEKRQTHLRWLERFGAPVLFFSWLPVVGDVLCALAGWLKMPFWQCAAWMAIGKFLRYTVMTAVLLWVPDTWWQAILEPFTR